MFAPVSSMVLGGEEPSIEFKQVGVSLETLKLLLGVLGVPLNQLLFGRTFSWLPRSLIPLVLPPILLLNVAVGWWPSFGERQSLPAWAQDPWDQQYALGLLLVVVLLLGGWPPVALATASAVTLAMSAMSSGAWRPAIP
jgi:hypothetical protein